MSKSEIPALATRVGRADWGDNQYLGHSVARDLLGTETFTGLLAMAITGRRFAPADCKVLDDLATAMTAPDPRIWPLKLTRLASSYGSVLAALAAGDLCLDEAYIGHWTSGTAATWLVTIRDSLGEAANDPVQLHAYCAGELERRSKLFGFGVPFRQADERVEMVTRCIEQSGRQELPYWTLFSRVSEALFVLKKLRPNIGVVSAAVCLDLGFSPRQVSIVVSVLGLNVFLANAVEGAAQAPEILRRLPDGAVRYVGVEPRRSPRAARSVK